MTDQVSVVALIVSLIALFIALAQVLQQYFATADGYRRCAESVIGVWQHRRHRAFVPSELRLETTYVTPEILLLSPSELSSLEAYADVDLLNSQKPKGRDYALVKKTVHPESELDPKYQSRWSRWVQTLGRWRRKLISQSHTADAEKVVETNYQQQVGSDRESELLVTWIQLMRQLHRVYSSYWPEDCKRCHNDWGSIDSAPRKVLYPSVTVTGTMNDDEGAIETRTNVERTDVAISYRVWKWDFMPPDVVRPLAKTTVGDIVILALRMGMEWRTLEPENGKMQADGNGCTFSALNINGLGIVVRFAARGRQMVPRVVPSRASDKMLCGIVPGDPELVCQDFRMVDNGRRVLTVHEKDGILEQIGVPRHNIDYIRDHHSQREPHNELIILMCPFLPVEGSTIGQILFHGWRPALQCHFIFWEGRLALLRGLRKKLDSESLSPELRKVLLQVRIHLDALEKNFRDDFYCRERAILNRQGADAKADLIKTCRNAFEYSTKALRESSGNFTEKDDSGQRRYLHLVAGHVCMATHAITTALDKIELQKKEGKDRSQEALRPEYGVGSDPKKNCGPFFVQQVWEGGCHYLTFLHDNENGVGAYLSAKGISLSKDEIEAAWWPLMLRGIAWGMSIWSGSAPGPPIPSSIYGNKTPVWLT